MAELQQTQTTAAELTPEEMEKKRKRMDQAGYTVNSQSGEFTSEVPNVAKMANTAIAGVRDAGKKLKDWATGSGTAEAAPATGEKLPEPERVWNVPEESPSEAANKERIAQAGSEVRDAVKSGKPDSIEQALRRLEQLNSDPKYLAGTPPDTQKSIQEAIDRAKTLYDEKANRNDWAEVVQIIARSIAQFGAAQHGLKSNQDMSNLNFGKGIDFDKRTDRAWNEYVQSLSEQKALTGEARSKYDDEEAAKRQGYSRERQALEDRIRYGRDKLSEDKTAARESERDRKLELQELNLREREMAKQLTARQALANQLMQEGDLSTKSAAKLQEKMGSLAAQADVDLTELSRELEGQTKPGMLYGTNPDPEKQQTLLKGKVQELRSMLDAVKARKAELLKGNAPQGETGSAPAAPKTVKIQSPDGEIAEVPLEKKEYYISKGGKVVQ